MAENYILEDVKAWLQNPVTQEVFRRLGNKIELLKVDIISLLITDNVNESKIFAAQVRCLQEVLNIGHDLTADLEENEIDET